MPRKSFNKPFEFLLYRTNRLHFSVCVFCNRSQKTSQRDDFVSCRTFLFFTRYDVICELLQYTHAHSSRALNFLQKGINHTLGAFTPADSDWIWTETDLGSDFGLRSHQTGLALDFLRICGVRGQLYFNFCFTGAHCCPLVQWTTTSPWQPVHFQSDRVHICLSSM